ncbi:MAG: hypothetical protein IIY16_02225, partial [Oscillospiraceae bacterium]|nr:hypothetical protein [Oscillospiraceae bacterium]
YCQGAPQQSANGTDAIFVILQHIVGALDEDKKYVTDLVSLASLKDRNNGYCQGADQQSANNLYRIMETLQILGYILEDKNRERIEQYWAEHSDEHAKLLQEKVNCQSEIAAIECKADAVNADAEISELEAEKTARKAEKERCGAEELRTLRAAVEQRKQERAQIGAFKFGLRKEAAAKIEAATAEYAAKEREVDAAKARIQKEIDDLARRISALQDDVQKQKDLILAACEPYQQEISRIDHELTKKR